VIVKYRTESIWMPTLSPVITPAGWNVTTCSRRSMSGRTRSTNGTTIARPGDRVRW
jgi:hypothetical protein